MPGVNDNLVATASFKTPCEENSGFMVGIKELSKPKYCITSLEMLCVLKSQKIPSDIAELVVVVSPVNFMLMKSPGKRILSIRL